MVQIDIFVAARFSSVQDCSTNSFGAWKSQEPMAER